MHYICEYVLLLSSIIVVQSHPKHVIFLLVIGILDEVASQYIHIYLHIIFNELILAEFLHQLIGSLSHY